jgi:translocator protein
MIPSWLVIGCVTLLIPFLIRPTSQDLQWFMRLRRPRWLTFEWAIPIIWVAIFMGAAWSATLVWDASRQWWLMGGYLLLEVATIAYTPVMCRLRSLWVGVGIGGSGFLICLVLSTQVLPISFWGFLLLVPYLLWSPIGTGVTWQMIRLNPGAA